MKRALIIASVASMIEQFNMGNIKLLQEIGYNVDVATNFERSGNITKEKSNELKKQLINMNVNCFQIDFDRGIVSKNNIIAYKQVKKIITQNTYNLIHLHSPIGGVCGRIAGRKERKKGTRIIYTAHGFHFFKGAPILNWIIYYPIEKWLSRYTDCLITINQEDYDIAKRKFKAKQIELVHGVGLDTSRLERDISQDEKIRTRKDLDINEKDIVCTYIAELNKNKNQILLINAIKELKKKIPNIKLLLIGKGNLFELYEKIIKENNLEENIKLLGYRDDINELLSITDIYLASSLREGLPVNIMEAMYKGIPVIATDNRGHREIIENNKTGFIINNQEELKEKVIELKKDNENK